MARQPAVPAHHTTPYDVAPAYPAVHFLEEVAHQRVAVGLEVATDLWDDKGTRGAGCWVTTRLAAWYFEENRRLAVAVFAVVPLRWNHPHRHTHNDQYVSAEGGGHSAVGVGSVPELACAIAQTWSARASRLGCHCQFCSGRPVGCGFEQESAGRTTANGTSTATRPGVVNTGTRL